MYGTPTSRRRNGGGERSQQQGCIRKTRIAGSEIYVMRSRSVRNDQLKSHQCNAPTRLLTLIASPRLAFSAAVSQQHRVSAGAMLHTYVVTYAQLGSPVNPSAHQVQPSCSHSRSLLSEGFSPCSERPPNQPTHQTTDCQATHSTSVRNLALCHTSLPPS